MNQVSIGSDNGLLPVRRQAIIWASAGKNFSEYFWSKYKILQSRKCIWKYLRKGCHFVQGGYELMEQKQYLQNET